MRQQLQMNAIQCCIWSVAIVACSDRNYEIVYILFFVMRLSVVCWAVRTHHTMIGTSIGIRLLTLLVECDRRHTYQRYCEQPMIHIVKCPTIGRQNPTTSMANQKLFHFCCCCCCFRFVSFRIMEPNAAQLYLFVSNTDAMDPLSI